MDSTTTIVAVVFLIAAFASLAVFFFKYIQNKSLEDIRTDVYRLFLIAEHQFKEEGTGRDKMQFVIYHARQLLPPILRLIVTEELLTKVIQLWFDAIKDLLDDGKYNGSTKENA